MLLDTSPGFRPFGFAGGLFDPDTGLVRFGARDYDPSTGRFLTRDPLLFGGGDVSLYAYAGGDPVNRVDPTGLGAGPSPSEKKSGDPDDFLKRLRDRLERMNKLRSALGDPDEDDPLGDLRDLKDLLDLLNDLNGKLELVDFGNVPVDFIPRVRSEPRVGGTHEVCDTRSPPRHLPAGRVIRLERTLP